MYTYTCKTESLFCIVEINMSTKRKRKKKNARKKEEDDDT